ncbi:HNH endonuclease [Enterococcus faecalis]|uniref:HNH endonuclease n=1 Tax=Enterococcus faecalis TaxID=1351 RepID=UPI00157330C1|nr:HNH endonuclease [Enterococcus faecalis]
MRYCQFEGCSNTTERGAYCSEHARSSRKKKKQGNVYHHENKSFYRTPAWRDMREVIYERDRGCCKCCGKFVFGRKAHVHHIVPIKNNPLLKLDPNNLILLCSECHPIVEQETETKKVFPSYF